MDTGDFERIPVYTPGAAASEAFDRFLRESGNAVFRCSRLTWVSLVFLLLVYPGLSLVFAEDPASLAENLNQSLLQLTLISTIMMQWLIFLLLYVTCYREQTGLAGLGLKKIRWIDLAWAMTFLLASNLILSGVAWFLGKIGLPMSGEIALLIPSDPWGRVLWVAVSVTAGFCEEIAFRGYVMTRLRLLGKAGSWLVPIAVSAFAFGVCHTYQGVPGFIVLTIYGLMFSLLYIRTRSLWPCIIAHFFQDFGALFFPQ